MKLPIKISLITLLAFALMMTMFVTPAMANDDILCGEDSADAAESIETIFLILSALGPVLGTLFWVALSVSEAASMNNDKSKQKRKVIVAGFSVPLAIAFANAIASEIVGVDVSCFFPSIG